MRMVEKSIARKATSSTITPLLPCRCAPVVPRLVLWFGVLVSGSGSTSAATALSPNPGVDTLAPSTTDQGVTCDPRFVLLLRFQSSSICDVVGPDQAGVNWEIAF